MTLEFLDKLQDKAIDHMTHVTMAGLPPYVGLGHACGELPATVPSKNSGTSCCSVLCTLL